MPLLSLPTDVLAHVLKHCCSIANITETCRDFADVANSTPSLWCDFYVGHSQFVANGLPFLRSRLERAGILPFKVTISLPGPEVDKDIVQAISLALSQHNTRIYQIELNTRTTTGAGLILSTLYPSPMSSYGELKSLSIKVEKDTFRYSSHWPQLDLLLQRYMPFFPNLRVLAVPTYYDSIPVFNEPAASFQCLKTLIFDGSLEQEDPSMALIVGLLHHTPQLETLWLKTLTRETSVVLSGPNIPRSRKNAQDVPIPIILPRLTSLAITAPGAGSDLLLCIDAPALRRVHLDGSRGPLFRERAWGDVVWSAIDTMRVEDALESLAQRSPNLLHLVMTSTYLTLGCWRWLLLGGGADGTPFPLLESLGLRDLHSFSAKTANGFTEGHLIKHSSLSNISLRKLSFRRCTFTIKGQTLVQVFTNFIERRPTSSYTLDMDASLLRVAEDDLERLRATGVEVRNFDKEEVYEWWSQGHRVDEWDSYVY